jgi:Ca2+-binding RTX toxin-like protein
VDLLTRELLVVTSSTSVELTSDDLLAGSDTISGDAGDDIIFGDHGSITQSVGTSGILTTSRVERARTVQPSVGAGDTIFAGADNDLVFGGFDIDEISGGDDHDVLFGDNGGRPRADHGSL